MTLFQVVTSGRECSSAMPYPTPGGVCQAELENYLLSMNCEVGDTPLVLNDGESVAVELVLALDNFLSPSPECREAVVPFLCLFLFGLCDTSGLSLQPTSAQCLDIRDRLCVEEWRLAAMLQDLPDCESLPSEQVLCTVNTRGGSGGGDGGDGPANNCMSSCKIEST